MMEYMFEIIWCIANDHNLDIMSYYIIIIHMMISLISKVRGSIVIGDKANDDNFERHRAVGRVGLAGLPQSNYIRQHLAIFR